MPSRRQSKEAAVDDDVRAAFELYDADHGGSIDTEELRGALEATGLIVSDDQVEYMLRKYDDDRSGTLDMLEFAKIVRDLRDARGSATQRRLNLRTHPKVTEALEAWWSAAIRSSTPVWRSALEESHATGEPPQLNQEQYTVALKKIFKAMSEEYDDDDAEDTAEEEWEHDRKGMYFLDSGLFMDGIFELADVRAPCHPKTTTTTAPRARARATSSHASNHLSPCYSTVCRVIGSPPTASLALLLARRLP